MMKSALKTKKTLLLKKISRTLIAGLLTSGSIFSQCWFSKPVGAQTVAYCHFSTGAIATKEQLRQKALQGNAEAQTQYEATLKEHGEILRRCRSQTWPKEQAIWLRLYPCDIRAGSIDSVLDQIVNRGYNRVNLEVFYDSQVLLPPAENTTPWISVVRSPGAENVDLLAEAIQKGRERGLQVYAWMFSLNFGYAYAQLSDRQSALARNGSGENSLEVVHDRSQAFVDPYNRQAQIDYYRLLEAVLRRRPDGVLFDYIRYPRGTGSRSVVDRVNDLWIYGEASQQTLLNRATNQKGRALIERYLRQGKITASDVEAVNKLYPEEKEPLWQGRNLSTTEDKASTSLNQQRLQQELWYLSVAHAAQGIVDFLSFISRPVELQGLSAGAVFFPGGNQTVGKRGFDSRLQPWNNFPSSLEWHPMSYSICNDASCIVQEIKRVTSAAPAGTKIIPALAGVWGQTYQDHPPLEVQMEAIRSSLPQINAVSHFAYSWQFFESDRSRRSCKLSN